MWKFAWLEWKLLLGGFRSRWLWIFTLNFEIQNGRLKFKNLLDWGGNYNSGVFEVADYESSLEISKSNMADQNVKNISIRMKMGVFGIAECVLNN